jgi:uncharacterized protein involved in exopolysaccharide biosynthesis
MSGDRPAAVDLGAEREIDLRRWLDALVSRWWIAVAGLVIGAIVGAVYSLSGGSSYVASATIARGQVFNPAGTAQVQGYITSPAQIQNLATSAANLDTVAAKLGLPRSALRGHVTTSTITSAGAPSTTNTNSVLVLITVTLNRPRKAEDAANALAALIKAQTTTRYVEQSIKAYQTKIDNYGARIVALRRQIDSLNKVLAKPGGLSPLDQLVLSTQLQGAQAALGQTLDSQTTAQQELILQQDVSTTQIIPPPARAQKTVARSRRNSVVFGALIGLIVGAIVAMVVGLRSAAPATA